MPSAEELADRFVTLTPPGRGSQHIRLEAPGGDVVEIGTYPNPTIARTKAASVRRWLAAVIRAAADDPPDLDRVSSAVRPRIATHSLIGSGGD